MVIMKASTKLETPSLLISSRPHVRGLHPHAEDILILETSVIFTSLGMYYVRERGWTLAEVPNIDSIAIILDFYMTGKLTYGSVN